MNKLYYDKIKDFVINSSVVFYDIDENGNNILYHFCVLICNNIVCGNLDLYVTYGFSINYLIIIKLFENKDLYIIYNNNNTILHLLVKKCLEHEKYVYLEIERDFCDEDCEYTYDCNCGINKSNKENCNCDEHNNINVIKYCDDCNYYYRKSINRPKRKLSLFYELLFITFKKSYKQFLNVKDENNKTVLDYINDLQNSKIRQYLMDIIYNEV